MKILIVDDHLHIRLGTAVSLREITADLTILEADSLARARQRFLEHSHIDLILLDLSLGDSEGIATLREVRAACEEAGQLPRIVIVSATEELDLIDSVLNEHGTGFIPKGVPGDIFKYAIQLTLAGGVYIPELYLRSRQARALPQATVAASQENAGKLTDTERLVASYCVQGLTFKQIARAISDMRGRVMSDLTVKTHVKNIAIKLGIQGEGKAAVVAQISRLGLRFPVERRV